MADLATELANLNAQAAELLAKYNGAFEKLDEETQNKIIELQDKAAELQAQIESLGFKFDENGILVKEDGSEISVGNALKLGGKSLEEIKSKVIFFYLRDTEMTSTGDVIITGFNNKIIDTHNSFDGENGIFKCPKGGIYRIFTQVSFYKGNGDDTQSLKFLINGNPTKDLLINNNATNADIELSQNFEYIVNLEEGDEVKIQIGSIDKGAYLRIYFGGVELSTTPA